MKKALKLDITKPCGENWKAFPKLQDGRTVKGHCVSCNKHVIDFTSWSDERVKEFFSTSTGRVCGRIRKVQLRECYINPDSRKPRSQYFAILISVWMLLCSRQAEAQTIEIQPPPQEQLSTVSRPIYAETAKGSISISGRALFGEDNSPAIGTNVIQQGTINGTVVNTDGTFTLPLKNPKSSVTLIFAFIGFKTQEITIHKKDYGREVNTVMMEMDVFLGGITVGRTISPRRWWWNIKDLFR